MPAKLPYAEAVRVAVAQAMEQAGVNATRLSQATGIAPTTLSRKLNGLAPFNVVDLDVIARSLDLDVERFSAPERAA